MDSEEPRVTVAVRVRPKLAFAVNALQQSERYEEVICLPTSDTSLHLAERRASKVARNMHFTYDHVFDVDATQEEVYEAAALDSVDGVLGGINASLLTYGQTGSGKTFTVLGATVQRVEGGEVSTAAVGPDSGLLLRAIQDMLTFAEAMQRKRARHVVLGITAIEIYNDEIRDLLREGGSGAGPLQPIMTRDALHFPGLTHVPLRSLRDACAVYGRAAARRVQRATSANDTSSRSHAVFNVEVFQTPMTTSCVDAPTLAECCALRAAQVTAAARSTLSSPSPPRCECFDGAPNVLVSAQGASILYSALTVADLAGSEKAKHAEVRGTGFDELRRINASLTALGNVVHHLYHRSPHIPYRDSKLTMVLRDAFAASRARVVLLVNVSPTALTCEETLSSLYFADKMKGMTAPDTATSPQQAALQASFLASLRVHDALLADLHIFHAQQEFSTGLLQRVASFTAEANPLQQLPFHTTLRDSQDKSQRLERLCEQLKEAAALAESPEARQQRFADVARREARKALLQQYSQRRAAVHAETAAVEQASEELRQELAATEAATSASLRSAAAAAQEVVATRRALGKTTAATLAALRSTVVAPSPDGDDHDNETEEGDDDVAHQSAVETTLKAALELAELRHTLVEFVAFNVRTDPAPPTPNDDGSEGRASPIAKSRSRSGTASSSTRPKLATVEAWLRSAVLAMAGNAVAQSTRRHAAAQAGPRRPPLGDVTNVSPPQPSTSSPKTRQLPKYWKVLQQEQPSEAVPQSATGKDTGEERQQNDKQAAVSGTRGCRSTFDDPNLMTRVTAYMDMGASLMKVGRTGYPRPRWFYLAQKEDRCMLCWDESRRGANLSGGGHVYLDAVVKIILGRSSPGFMKYANLTATEAAARTPRKKATAMAGTEKGGDDSFTVVYRTRANRRDFKFVDVICPNKNEMETWVVGLSHWAGVSPIFEDSRQPDGSAERGGDGGSSDENEAAREAQPTEAAARLTAQEAVLSRVWHIPADVLQQTRKEVDTRRSRHHAGRLRLTPGELRDLTGLDIFRASALWRHFEKEGWVVNPTTRLCCFADLGEPDDAAKAIATPAEERTGRSQQQQQQQPDREVTAD